MRNQLTVIYYPLKLIWQLFTYLQEIIIYEFPWLTNEPKTLEILESKRNRAYVASRRVSDDLMTFLGICTFLVVLIILSLKFPKDDDDNDENEKDGENEDRMNCDPGINDGMTEASESTYLTAFNESKDNLIRHDCGDSQAIPRLDQHPDLNFTARNHQSFFNIPDFTDSTEASETSALSLSETTTSHAPERQQVQRKVSLHRHVCRRAAKHHYQYQHHQVVERDYVVRRTRSGQIYGKYPL